MKTSRTMSLERKNINTCHILRGVPLLVRRNIPRPLLKHKIKVGSYLQRNMKF